MAKTFASRGDTAAKTISFTQLSENAWAFTAEGDPNSGVIVGDDAVMVVDAQATPAMAEEVIRRIRSVTDKPIKYLVLSHYHAVRVLGAAAYKAQAIIASRATYELIRERGEQDWKSEYERFPRLFQAAETIPGLTWPNVVFEKELTVWLGRLEVRILHPGRGHTAGDTVVWLPAQKVLFSGDLVEYNAGIYCGDAHFADWPQTLERLRALAPEKLVPGRGPALLSREECRKGIEYTQRFVRELYELARREVAQKKTLPQVYAEARAKFDPIYGAYPIYEHCMPFDVSRAYDEASGIAHPRIWTAERDQELWRALEG